MITITDKQLIEKSNQLIEMLQGVKFSGTFAEMYNYFRSGIFDVRELFHELGVAQKAAHFSDELFDNIDSIAVFHGDASFSQSKAMKKSLSCPYEYMSHVVEPLTNKSALRGPGYYFHSTFEGAATYAKPPGMLPKGDAIKRVLKAKLSSDTIFFDKYKFHALLDQINLSKKDFENASSIAIGGNLSQQEKLSILGLLIKEKGLATFTSALFGGDGFVYEEGVDGDGKSDSMLKYAVNNRDKLYFPKKGYESAINSEKRL